ncbi:outer membrane protein/protective antigen OMA87 [Terriglobus roseus DSM 18391]|uniref:Outer membrane protein/protective antigen OMA87 n=1 Tax=Terriglobus roseus (strain DSM 18391 / NRRL B-41598 / KBS 63) TaxID=926566 RepID=I3ZJN9_TERRK|nr:outer membrane protein assembly factor [Terriglobus roseus]AFL89457.1 outer membrane protein/protective antigen OMA87 [Terriglobus roseus DSM 18391]
MLAAAIACTTALAHAQEPNGQPSSGANTPASATPTTQSTTPAAPATGEAKGSLTGAAGSVGSGVSTAGATSGVVAQTDAEQQAVKAAQVADSATSGLFALRGRKLTAINFDGVEYAEGDPLPGELGLKPGDTLDPAKIRAATRRLFLTGLYRDIQVRSSTGPDGGVTLTFDGRPRFFIGRVRIQGVKVERLMSLLESSTQLQPGLPFTNTQVKNGEDGIRQTLARNGYYQPLIHSSTEHLPDGKQVDVIYSINVGVKATVGKVTLTGDPGISVEEFRKRGKLKEVNKTLFVLKSKNKVTTDTTGNALTNLRQFYQKKERLEAAVALEKSEYASDRKQLDYTFRANQGPIVKVTIEGTKVSNARRKKLLPIYEESAVDNDLLNEGAHNIREFLQRQGYFDAEVTQKVQGVPDTPSYSADGTPLPPPSDLTETVTFHAEPGKKYKVIAVNVTGNKYFETDNIKERMQVVKADAYVRNGRFSPVLLANDVDSITSLYRANGFNKVKITSKEVKGAQDKKVATITVNITIDEGVQQKFGEVTMTGANAARVDAMKALITAEKNQPFALANVSNDRDNILQQYLSKGFDQAKVEVRQTPHKDDPTITDVTYLVTEGEQVAVDRVLISGRHHVRAKLVNDQLLLKPGDPLDESAILEMQRRYYDLALFNEANVAVQNPEGLADRKNVLVQLSEAKRWDVTYGAGFETQLSTPQTNCRAQQSLGGTGSGCTPEGRAGASFRVSADVTRINLFGTDQSITFHSTYGLLERIATATYNVPKFVGHKNLSLQFSGGYSNVQNISTFKASTLQGLFRLTQKVPKTDTFIYDFTYRRVSVDQNSLQVTANLIPLLSQPVRVGGPGFTWFHDTRSPSPLDATKGMYLSVTDFLANSKFGSQTNFNKIDSTFSTYYSWGKKRKYTFARSTRFGIETQSGANPNAGIFGCEGVLLTTNASCNAIPLPERLYAGGATSHRGFGINQAGPRDLTTGFPVGGSAALVNTLELRMPPPVLPIVGDSVSFVVFHDMGNVFLHPGDMFKSIARFQQPNQQTCRQVTGFKTVGTCDFAYFSHALGLGARYNTPVGPIRVDAAYNLNPPIYPIIDDYTQATPNHRVGQGGRFQFFFSIGQSF